MGIGSVVGAFVTPPPDASPPDEAMSLHLYDTLRREKVPFEPRDEGKVSIYVCGPTVQAPPHIGHGRATVVFDVLRRHLVATDHEVLHVANVTDVDDKIILRAARERTAPAIVAARNLRAYNDALDALGNLAPTVQPLATAHIAEMQALIQELLDQDKAYVADGNVLFRVRRFDEYGKLSNRAVDDLQTGEDVVGAEGKDDPLDFAMWKAAKEGEVSWPSPWGPGRPGWHIECSAMARRHLGHGFDIHGGGFDLVFPHHENEIAQYEAAHGTSFARYWMHNGMVRMGEEKMSKSLGNIIGLHEAVQDWGKGPLRLWYLSAHHRSPLTYDTDRLTEASAAFARLSTFVRTADALDPVDDTSASELPTPFVEAFRAALDDDLNAPAAVAQLHELVTAGHDRVAAAGSGDADALADVAAARAALVELADDTLGLGLGEVAAEAAAMRRRVAPLVTALLEDRAAAREAKDWDRADAVRDQLAAAGVVVEDRAGTSHWHLGDLPDPS